jgi:hypothetical protein
MIQLATDPHASRSPGRPAGADGKDNPLAAASRRSGHAWPFISRHGESPTPADKRTPSSDKAS